MSDFGAVPPREEPHDGAHDAVRDALPALLHGRVTASERADLERHLAHCGACDTELQTLASVRDLYATSAPTIAVDRIAAAVRARTVPVASPARDGFVVRTGSISSDVVAEPVDWRPGRGRGLQFGSALPAWTRSGALRAFAASALLAVGSGALLFRAPASRPANAAVAVAAAAPHTTTSAAADRDPNGTLLGASFSDLSDSELAAVVAAVDDPTSSTPAAEPSPVAPNVLTPDGE